MDFHCSRGKKHAAACVWLLGAALILLFSPVRAWSWGCEGHQAVAMIAEKHMNRHALERVNQLLRSVPIDPALPLGVQARASIQCPTPPPGPTDIRKPRPETVRGTTLTFPRRTQERRGGILARPRQAALPARPPASDWRCCAATTPTPIRGLMHCALSSILWETFTSLCTVFPTMTWAELCAGRFYGQPACGKKSRG